MIWIPKNLILHGRFSICFIRSFYTSLITVGNLRCFGENLERDILYIGLPLTADESDKGWWGGILEQLQVQGFHLWWWRWWALSGRFPWTIVEGRTLPFSASNIPSLCVLGNLNFHQVSIRLRNLLGQIFRKMFMEKSPRKRNRRIVKTNSLPFLLYSLGWFISFCFLFVCFKKPKSFIMWYNLLYLKDGLGWRFCLFIVFVV